MTGAENERLAVVETKLARIEADVAEIKSDVKGLVHAETANEGRRNSRSDLGIWVRAALPLAIGVGSALITLVGILTR